MKARSSVRQRSQTMRTVDWRELKEGEAVHIVRNARIIFEGLVDEVSDSGRVLWLKNYSQETEVFNLSEGVIVQRVGTC
jgi:hypothetical protein